MNIKRAFLMIMAVLLLPGLAFAQAPGTALFVVQKSYTDGATIPVMVRMVCDSGNPLDQSLAVNIDNNFEVAFVLDNIPDLTTVSCTITESGGDSDYTADYTCSGDSTTAAPCAAPAPGSAASCIFSDVAADHANACDIANSPDNATVKVSKDWVTTNAGGNEVNFFALVEARSSSEILGAPHCVSEPLKWCSYLSFVGGSPADQTIIVKTDKVPVSVVFSETVYDSSVEVTNGCGTVWLSPGEDETCTFTNTVYYEGIPTLNQYGMAILALLMLGVGFIGFRRFV